MSPNFAPKFLENFINNVGPNFGSPKSIDTLGRFGTLMRFHTPDSTSKINSAQYAPTGPTLKSWPKASLIIAHLTTLMSNVDAKLILHWMLTQQPKYVLTPSNIY